jgi:acyl carrier protein
MSDDLRAAVRDLILTEFLPGESPENLTDDMPLRTSGVIDSLAVLRLTAFLEERCRIRIEAHETGVEHFDSVDDIVRFAERKQGRGNG